ncbi:type II secretion system protein [Natronoarchaeum mannanilyticum]|uniref:Type II secretion system protein n=1 Tax=Natronoarchaeum mannanilyticum TaxID=926360 RepID=A0AAV3T5C0_9EURY
MLARLLRTLARLSPTGVSDDGPGAAPRAATNGDPSPGTDGTGFGVASASQRADDESDASPELRRSLSFLDLSVDAGTVVEAGYGAAVVISVALAPTVLLAPPAFRPAAVLFVLVAALGVTHAVHRLPAVLAAARRALALGAAPSVVGRAVLRMRVTPTAESAAAFAAETGDGPLADSLATHVSRAEGTAGSGLDRFAAEWERWFPELGRAVTLLDAAATAQPGERSRALDRSLRAVLDGTRDRMARFAGTIREPTTALYAFGVLLPLALIAVAPAARLAGIPISPAVLIALYCVALPGVVFAGACWLLLRRPVAFPPPPVDRSHPDVTGGRWRPVAVGVGAAGGGAALATAAPGVGTWAAALAATGCGVGAGLAWWYRPITSVRDHAREVDEGLPDALYLVGRGVRNGAAVETAIERAGARLDGATGAVLADAARRQRQLRIGVRTSFLGDRGALADVPSPRARSTASLLALAAREGRPAGTAIVSMAGHLEELQSVEADARRELATITGTLRSTATIFGPLVAGVTVALSDRMAALGDGAEAVPTAVLGPVVGFYVLALAAILTALAIGLERGLDRALVGYRVGGAVLSATCIYLAAFVAAGLAV